MCTNANPISTVFDLNITNITSNCDLYIRTFKTEKLEENEWKEMPEFPFRDFDENAYLYHTSEVTINNEVLLFGGSCGGQCAHEKAFKFSIPRLYRT